MADYSDFGIDGLKTELIDYINNKFDGVMSMDYLGDTNVKQGAIGFNFSANNWIRLTASGWGEITSEYNINVRYFNGQNAAYYLSLENATGVLPGAKIQRATTKRAGSTMLTNQIDSNKEDEALTAKAGNELRLISQNKANASHTHAAGDLPSGTTSVKGVVQLSPALSESRDLAATPSMVSFVYKAFLVEKNHNHPKSDVGLGNVDNYPTSDDYASNKSNLNASTKCVANAYNALYISKLGKNETVDNSNKLGGVPASDYFNTSRRNTINHTTTFRTSTDHVAKFGTVSDTGSPYMSLNQGTTLCAYLHHVNGGGTMLVNQPSRDYIRITNTGNFEFYTGPNTTREFMVTPDGTVHTDGGLVASSTTTNSDRGLKNSIQYVNKKECFDKVRNLKPATFELNKRPGITKTGLIAQDVQEHMPEAINVIDDGLQKVEGRNHYLGIEDNAVMANVIGAIGYLSDENVALKNTLKLVIERLNELETSKNA